MSPSPRYPRRPPRLAHPPAVPLYFVTFNTFKRARLLDHVVIHDTFRAYCGEAVRRGTGVGRYVIMPEHIHLFVRFPPDGPTLARWIQGLRAVLGKALLKMKHEKPHWQEGFFDHVLRNDEGYTEKWRYVAENPVRAGLTAKAEDWPYQGEMMVIDRA